jgi:hypothetical protein
MRKIKLFENFSAEEYEVDKVYEKWVSENKDLVSSLLESINEQEKGEDPEEDDDDEEEGSDGNQNTNDWLSDDELTPGERRALDRELQVVSKEQLAALYLKALGKYEFGDSEKKGRGGSVAERVLQDTYVTNIPNIEGFCSEDWRSGKLYIGPAGLSDAIGLESKTTLTRTVNKFYLLLSQGSGSYEEVVYPKIIDAFNYFKDKKVDVIQSIAAEAIQDPATSTTHRSLVKEKGISKEQSINIGKSIHSLFLDLYKNPFFNKDVCKVQKNAVTKISNLSNIKYEEARSFYKEYLTKNRMLDKFNWCNAV